MRERRLKLLVLLHIQLDLSLRQSCRLQHKSGTDDAALSSTVGYNLAPMACLLSHTGAPGDVTDEVTQGRRRSQAVPP